MQKRKHCEAQNIRVIISCLIYCRHNAAEQAVQRRPGHG